MDESGIELTIVETADYHNFVGVDGYPIQVRGLVCLPVIIAETRFQQKFVNIRWYYNRECFGHGFYGS